MTGHEEMARKIVNAARVHTVSNAELYEFTLAFLKLSQEQGFGKGLNAASAIVDRAFGKAKA